MSDLTASLRALNSELIARLRAAEAAKSDIEHRLEKEQMLRQDLEQKLVQPNPLSYSSVETGDSRDSNVTVSISESSVSVKEEEKNWFLVTLHALWQRVLQVFHTVVAIVRPQRQDRLPIP